MDLTNFNSIRFTVLRYCFYACVVGGMVLCLNWEAMNVPTNILFNESSLLECLQVAALVLIALFALWAGCMDPSKESLALILAGAALIACIREFDFALDKYVFDGAWQLLASVTAMVIFFAVFRRRESLASAVQDFVVRPSFGIMMSGFMSVVVFSRLFGRKLFWKAVMGEGYIHAVKNGVEEGCELMGYTLILIALVEFCGELASVRQRCESADDKPCFVGFERQDAFNA